MSPHVRNTLALAALVAVYGIALWLYESKRLDTWARTYATNPRAIWSREFDRERLMAEEFKEIPTEVKSED